MKKLLLLVKTLPVCWLLLLCTHSSQAQVAKPQKITEAQAKELAKLPAINDSKGTVSSVEKDRLLQIKAYLYKAILHRSDKTKYPVDNSDELEKRLAGLVGEVPEKNFQHANTKVQATISDKVKRESELGKYADLVFAGSLKQQIQMKRPEWKMSTFKPKEIKIKDNRKIQVLIEAVHCIDETNPEGGDDDILLSGLFWTPWREKMKAGNTFFCGRFAEDGAYSVYNDYELGNVEYSFSGDYPQVCYATMVVAEADQDEQEAVREFNSAMEQMCTMVLANGNDISLELMKQVTNGLLELFISDVHFPAYGIKVELRDRNTLYINDTKVEMHDNGMSYEVRSDNINAHGGSYCIKFRLKRN